ncbi:hypothetical protein [Falsirhodobacter sp. 20TX0035]|uniref:hypothetical protein n=1 Tax=Falsirhodobacter sp. 20TX0035 TaxID=3022019 RepID=UPI00232C6AD6|nr:hypothetical protein [Falsirhodobacter sp. 20TX0035]MDB6453114.1 hypothetical protein [Falsirhodobacter sp. 20TX0035]
MIDFVRRSAKWLGTAEYTVMMGAVWLGPMPVPVFRVSGNEACRVAVLLTLWAATAGLTLADLAFGSLPSPYGVAHWVQARI